MGRRCRLYLQLRWVRSFFNKNNAVTFCTNSNSGKVVKQLQKRFPGQANLRLPAWQRHHTRLKALLVVCSRRLTIYHGFKYMERAMKCLTTVCNITLRQGIMLTNLANSSGACASGFYTDDAEESRLLYLSATDKRFRLIRRKQEI